MKHPFFYILVNTRNAGAKLDRCLSSLISQDFQDWEALVTEDSSSDNTPEILKEFLRKDSRIKGYFNEHHCGANVNTLNRLSDKEGSAIVVVLDGDDYLFDRGSLRSIYEMYARDPLVEVTLGGAVREVGGERTHITINSKDFTSRDTYFFSHCRTFKLSLFKRIPLKYFSLNGKIPYTTSIDVIVHGLLTLIASKIGVFNTPLYVWDISKDTQHDFEYPSNAIVHDPLSTTFKRASTKMAYLLNGNKQRVVPLVYTNKPSSELIQSLPEPSILYSGNFLSSKVVIVVPVYNPEDKLLRCLQSISQVSNGHEGVGILAYEDCSTKPDRQELLSLLNSMGLPFCLMSNQVNKKKSHNLFQISRRIPLHPETLLLFLDGDDYFPKVPVIKILQEAYLKEGLEASLGNLVLDDTYPQSPRIQKALNRSFEEIPKDFSRIWNMDACWGWYHLKACLFKVFNKVEPEFFTEEDNVTFLQLGEDNFVFPRCLEIASHKRFLQDILYVYDTSDSTGHEPTGENLVYVFRIRKNKRYDFSAVNKNNLPSTKIAPSLAARFNKVQV